MKKLIIFVLLASLLMAACQKKNTVKKEANSIKSVAVMAEKIINKDLETYVKLTGRLEGKVDITLTSETSGRVTRLHKKLGDWVEKNETIGRVNNADTRINLEQAKANLLAAEAGYEAAQLSMTSSEKLFKAKNISKAEYAGAKSTFKSAKAGVDGAHAGLEMSQKVYDNSRFTAPVSGYIAYLPIRIGESINPGNTICHIVNSKELIIRSGVSAQDIYNIKVGQTVSVEYNDLNVSLSAMVTGVGISPVGANYPVEIALSNPEGKLYPGMVVNCMIHAYTHENILYTSLNNVIKQYDDDFLFVIDADNIAQKRKVVLGQKINEFVIILDGVKPGEILVTEGMESLNNGSLVKIRQAAK